MMSLKNPATKNNLPIPLQSLTPKELFLYTGIPLNRLETIARGEFKSSEFDQKKLSYASVPFYNLNVVERDGFVQRKKYRIIRRFVSPAEKIELLSDLEKYLERLDALIDKYWDQIVIAFTDRELENSSQRK